MEAPRDPDDDARQHAIGVVVLESAYLERLLKAVFTALVGSKYAAITAANLSTGSLIEQCRVLVDVHPDIDEDGKALVRSALDECADGARRRNRVVHDAWARRPGGRAVTLQSQRKPPDITVTARTTDDLRRLGDDLGLAADKLSAAARAALGEDCLLLEDRLRQELGRHIGADPGSNRRNPKIRAAAADATGARR